VGHLLLAVFLSSQLAPPRAGLFLAAREQRLCVRFAL
jgi:hypothetical protein